MKDNCQICKRKIGKLAHAIFIADEGNWIGPPLGIHYITCGECCLSYMAQWLGRYTMKDLDDQIKWWASV